MNLTKVIRLYSDQNVTRPRNDRSFKFFEFPKFVCFTFSCFPSNPVHEKVCRQDRNIMFLPKQVLHELCHFKLSHWLLIWIWKIQHNFPCLKLASNKHRCYCHFACQERVHSSEFSTMNLNILILILIDAFPARKYASFPSPSSSLSASFFENSRNCHHRNTRQCRLRGGCRLCCWMTGLSMVKTTQC